MVDHIIVELVWLVFDDVIHVFCVVLFALLVSTLVVG